MDNPKKHERKVTRKNPNSLIEFSIPQILRHNNFEISNEKNGSIKLEKNKNFKLKSFIDRRL